MSRPWKPSLSWTSAAKIAWREVRASKAKFFFVIVSVAIGVAALTGVRGFSNSFQRTLLGEARSLMAADLSARMSRAPTEAEERLLKAISAAGVERTQVTELISMASSPGDPVPLLVSLKAVDPARYPFYGQVQLNDGRGGGRTLAEVLTDSTVVVADGLLVRLHTAVGAPLKIGNSTFRIAAVIEREPDRMNSTMGLGPRVMMTETALAGSGLMQPGARSTERFLFKLPPGKVGVSEVRTKLEEALPDAQVLDFRETNPALTTGLNRSTALLSLICLVALVLGAIGVGMAMRAHLAQRIEVLAMMKSLGARSSGILRIYLLQTGLLGLVGGLIGVGLGLGIEWIFPSLLGPLLPVRTDLRFPLGAAAAGLATGILSTLLFCLPPLLDIRKIRPNLVLRRIVEREKGGRASWSLRQMKSRIASRAKEEKVQWIMSAGILLGLASIAAALSGSAVVGRWFALALCALLLTVFALAAVSLYLLRAWLEKTRQRLNAALRHGLANLYRPGNQSAAVLAALALGVMLVLTVFLMQHAVIAEMRQTILPSVPNVFLLDIGDAELAGVKRLLAQQPEVRGVMETLPIIQGRIVSVDGQPAATLRTRPGSRRLLQTVPLTWSQVLPAGDKVARGKWWDKDDGRSFAVTERVAARLHLQPGSEVTFFAQGRTIRVRLVAVIKHDGQHVYGRSEFILTSRALAGLPVIWYGAAHVEPRQVGALEGALFSAYPTVTAINVADVVETIQGVVERITLVVRFLAAFSILAGVLILASTVAGTRFRRIREVVVLKTLGARRSHIAAVFSVEFFVLGLLAGAVGAVFANLLARGLLGRLDVQYRVDWPASLAAILGCAALAVSTGWLASFRILGQKPLQVLREE